MIRENQGSSGYMVLQDHDASFPLDMREWRGAFRLTGKDKYGRRIIEKGSAGDIICSVMWEPKSRPLPGWANAWPTVVLGTQGDQGIGSSGEDGDPNVAAGGAGNDGVAGSGKTPKSSDQVWQDRGTSRQRFVPDNSVDPWAGRGGTGTRHNSGGRLDGAWEVDAGAQGIANGRLTGWTRGGGNADAIVRSRVEQQRKDREAWKAKQVGKGGGAQGGVGESGNRGPGGAVPPGARRPVTTGGKGSDQGPRSVGILPMRAEGHLTDKRFSPSGSILPDYWPSFPEGYIGLTLGGTEERSQQNIFLPTDPRLFSVNKQPKGIMGTLVFDLEPDGKVAIGDGEPGIAGRGARLQTFSRVVRTPANIKHLNIQERPCGNVLAWQGALTGQEGWPGLGAYYTICPATSKTTSGGSGARTPTAGSGGQGAKGDRGGGGPAGVTVQVTSTTAVPGGAALCFADQGSMGPFHGGFVGDKHNMDKTLDGEEIQPVHISPLAYYPVDLEKDAPLEFSDKPYSGGKWPLTANTHLSYNPKKQHRFFNSMKDGLWMWWTEVPYMGSNPPRDITPDPGDDPKPDPKPKQPPVITPKDPPGSPPPGGPPPGRPPVITPPAIPGNPDRRKAPAGAPGTPERFTGPPGLRGGEANDAAAFRRYDRGGGAGQDAHVYSPMLWSLGGLLARPQLALTGADDLRDASATKAGAKIEASNATRPVVGRIEAWGAQYSAEWAYQNPPGVSRYVGGDAAGGFMLLAPQVDLADIDDSFAPAGVTKSSTYLAFTPGTYSAWGVPQTTGTARGDLANGAVRAGVISNVFTMQAKDAGAWTKMVEFAPTNVDFTAQVIARAGVKVIEGAAPTVTAEAAILWAEDDGNDATRLLARFESGADQVVAHEQPYLARTSGLTLVAGDSRKTFSNDGAAGSITFTLPAAAGGLVYTFLLMEAQAVVLQAVGTDVIRRAGTTSTAGGTLTSAAAAGNVCTLYGTDGGEWLAMVVGTWTAA